MIEFGNTLRSAREQKGLSLEQIAEATHISRSRIEALENEQFDCFAAPIYVRGYIKLFCETVGIDHKPLVDEFMEIYNGNREPAIRERDVVPTEPPAECENVQPTEPQDTEAVQAEPVVQQTISEGSLFPDDPIAEPQREIPAPTFSDNAAYDGDDTQSLSRYAAPIREYDGASAHRNRFFRIGLLVCVVAACCYCIFLGLRALYRVTTPANAEQAKSEEVQKIDAMIKLEAPPAKEAAARPAKSAPAAPTAPTNRTPAKIDPLFID